MSTVDGIATTWRDHPATRVLGSAFSWFSLVLALTLLFQAVSELAALGGFCARGGPYVIAVECTDAIVVFAPGSIIGGLISLFIGTFLAKRFGASAVALAWPALFTSLAVIFVQTFIASGDWSLLLTGVVFFAMGLVPLALLLKVAMVRIFVGGVDVRGEPLWPATPGARRPGAAEWMLSLGIAISCAIAGFWLAIVWFAAVATTVSG